MSNKLLRVLFFVAVPVPVPVSARLYSDLDWVEVLQTQQRYLSYRAILVAILSHHLLVFDNVFYGVSRNYRAMSPADVLPNCVSHRCACVKLSTKGPIDPCGRVLPP